MKAPYMSKEQYEGIHDHGFAIHYRAILNMVSHLDVYQCERINTQSKRPRWIDFFSYVECLEANIFQCGFVEEHKVCVNNHNIIGPQRREMKSRLWQLNQNFWSPRKKY